MTDSTEDLTQPLSGLELLRQALTALELTEAAFSEEAQQAAAVLNARSAAAAAASLKPRLTAVSASSKDQSAAPCRERDEFFMRLAMAQARLAASLSEIPVGAVLVNEAGAVIAQGCNRTLINHDPSAHAEMLALRQAGERLGRYRLNDLTLYVTLEPCIMCVGALIHARVKRVVFGAYDGKTGACGSMFSLMQDRRHNHRVELTGGVLYSECAHLLQSFFRGRRRLLKAKRLSPSALSAKQAAERELKG